MVEIGIPGSPGPLLVYGPEAFPLVVGATGSGHAPVVAASRWQAGRVVALGHGGYFQRATIETADTARLITNALFWAAGEEPSAHPRIGVISAGDAREFRAYLEEVGHDVVEVALTPGSLGTVDVVALVMWNQSERELKALSEFVRAGGGLLTASTGWGWAYLHPQLDLVNDYSGNRLLSPIGIQWGHSEWINRTSPNGYAVIGPPNELTHGGAAMDAMDAYTNGDRSITRSDIAQATDSLVRAFRSMPADDTLLRPRLRSLVDTAESDERWPSNRHTVRQYDALDRLLTSHFAIEHDQTPAEHVRPHPASADFPGSVPDDAPRVTRNITIDTAAPRWHSTGLYAAPGESITVKMPFKAASSGFYVRVGAHTDEIWGRSEWRRMPEISRRFPVSATETLVANAFGGLIYIEVPNDARLGRINVEIAGAVEAPLFVLGETDLDDWRETIRHAPAPWAEIAGENMIVTTESREVRDLDDPAAVAEVWDRALDLSAELAAWPSTTRTFPERFVVDRQISNGYMHAGYPIMAHLDQKSRLVNAEHLSTCAYEWTQSAWGFYHEVGHNHQNYDWTFDGTVEVTVNLFTLYVHEFLCGIPLHNNWRGTPEFRAKQMAKYDFDAPDFEQWKSDPFLALVMYQQLQQDFGWDAYRQVFAEYRALPDSQRPRSDDEKRDQWMVRFSRQVGRNLGPFFEAWGVPTSRSARNSIAHLPVWMPQDFPPE